KVSYQPSELVDLPAWAADADLRVVGKPYPRVEGMEKVTGRARYALDQRLPRQLFAAVLRSPHPHARVTRIDHQPGRGSRRFRGAPAVPERVQAAANAGVGPSGPAFPLDRHILDLDWAPAHRQSGSPPRSAGGQDPIQALALGVLDTFSAAQ